MRRLRLSYERLELMENVVTTKNNFELVQATVDWNGMVDFKVDFIVGPFNDAQ